MKAINKLNEKEEGVRKEKALKNEQVKASGETEKMCC